MKPYLLMLMLCLAFKTQAQKSIEAAGNYYSYTGVIKVDTSLNATQLYSVGFEWFANIYNNSRFVIQMQDKEAGIIIGKALFTTHVNLGLMVGSRDYITNYTIKLSFKNGRIKYDIYDFISDEFSLMKDGKVIKYVEPFGHGVIDRGYAGVQTGIVANSLGIIDNLNSYFTKKQLVSKNW